MSSPIWASDMRITIDGVLLDAPTLAPADGMSVSFTFSDTTGPKHTLTQLAQHLSWDGNGISPEDRKVIDEGTEACIDAAMLNYEWPRVNVAADLLAFVAAGSWTRAELRERVASYLPRATSKGLAWHFGELVDGFVARIIRRAKAERRVWWCPHSQRYEALPAWRHRRVPSRHPWPWPHATDGNLG